MASNFFKTYAPLIGMGAKALSAAWDAVKDDFYVWLDETQSDGESGGGGGDPAYEEFLRQQRAKVVDGAPGLGPVTDDGTEQAQGGRYNPSAKLTADPSQLVL
jgi:hypothetical protein